MNSYNLNDPMVIKNMQIDDAYKSYISNKELTVDEYNYLLNNIRLKDKHSIAVEKLNNYNTACKTLNDAKINKCDITIIQEQQKNIEILRRESDVAWRDCSYALYDIKRDMKKIFLKPYPNTYYSWSLSLNYSDYIHKSEFLIDEYNYLINNTELIDKHSIAKKNLDNYQRSIDMLNNTKRFFDNGDPNINQVILESLIKNVKGFQDEYDVSWRDFNNSLYDAKINVHKLMTSKHQ